MLLFQRTKVRRFRRDHDAEAATDWLEQVAASRADAVTAPSSFGACRLPTGRASVRPGGPFTRALPTRPRPRVIAGNAPAAEQRLRLAAVPKPSIPALFIPALPTARAPQPSPATPNPLAVAQAVPGRTYTLTIPAAPTYAERLAAVFDNVADRFTQLSGWLTNRGIDDDEVTHARFMGLRDRFADLLPPLPMPELVAA